MTDATANATVDLRSILEHTTDVIVRVALDGGVDFVSPAIRNYGYAPEDLLGTDGLQLIHPDDRERFAANAAALLRQEVASGVDREHRVLCADGRVAWIEGNPYVIRHEDGRPAAIVNVFRDVTERHHAEARAREQSDLFEATFANVAVGQILLRSDGVVDRVNATFCAMIGREPGDLVGRSISEVIHPDDREATRARAVNMVRGKEDSYRTDLRYLRPDGSALLAEGTVVLIRDATGRPSRLLIQAKDVSEIRAAEAALRDSEARYRLIAENSTDMIVVTALSGQITYLSPAVRNTGWTPEDLQGRGFGEHMHPDDAKDVARAFGRLLKGGEPSPVRWRGRPKLTGDWIWMESRPGLLRDPATQAPVGFVDVVRNIAEQVRQEEALVEARAIAESAAQVKADFMANMSHEIRTPLTAILGFTSLLSARAELEDGARTYVDRIAGGGRALLALVNDVLDFSKLEAGQMAIRRKPSSTRETLSDALALFEPQAAAKRVDLILDLPDTLPSRLDLDPDKLRQVLLNLIGNGLKFTDRGAVTLSATFDHEAQRLRLGVRDTGPGMDEAQQAKLFQRFSQVDASSTRRHGGTGLGLVICLGLVEAMGGEIGVSSRLGEGSEFAFWIDAPVSPEVEDEPASATGLDLEGVRLLIVDDNSINHELVSALMSPLGLEISSAGDGVEAVDMAMTMPFDVILMDMRMPRMDGGDATLRIRGQSGPNQNTPILAFSADFDLERKGEHARLGFDGLVRKPIDAQALFDAVASAVDWRQTLPDLVQPEDGKYGGEIRGRYT